MCQFETYLQVDLIQRVEVGLKLLLRSFAVVMVPVRIVRTASVFKAVGQELVVL